MQILQNVSILKYLGVLMLCLHLSSVMAMRPYQSLMLLAPRSSGTPVYPIEDGATEENNSTKPGLLPQPAPDTLDKG